MIMNKSKRILLVFLLLTFVGPVWLVLSGKVDVRGNWRTATRVSAEIAPKPASMQEALIQVYAARAFGARGLFAVHTWIATKKAHAKSYWVYQAIGWRVFQGKSVLVAQKGIPDRYWFGQRPHVILDIRGDRAAKLIPKIEQAVANYPYNRQYSVWPGPNSNTFTGYIARAVPQLGLVLPATAIGKDYFVQSRFIARAPSDTGYQVSFYGLLGIMIAKKEGFQLNILGLVFGVDVLRPAIILPGIGRVGYSMKG